MKKIPLIKARSHNSYEADPSAVSISINSPIAKALIGKEIGNEIQVKTPSGIKNFEILEIEI